MPNLNEGLHEIEKNIVSEINDFLEKLQIKKCQTEKHGAPFCARPLIGTVTSHHVR